MKYSPDDMKTMAHSIASHPEVKTYEGRSLSFQDLWNLIQLIISLFQPIQEHINTEAEKEPKDKIKDTHKSAPKHP